MKNKVVVFGRGQYFSFKREELIKKYEIIGFLDNDVNEKDSIYDGCVPIKNPTKWRDYGERVFFLLMAQAWFEMFQQLCKIGVPESKIKLGIMETPSYNELEKFFHNERIIVESSSGAKIHVRKGLQKDYFASTIEELKAIYRKLYFEKDELIRIIKKMPLNPSSRSYGIERGMSIDRVYIEDFLQANSARVQGVCMEIGDDTYIKRYGHNVEETIILHVYGKGNHALKGNFETGVGLKDNSVDCIICTQTLQALYDIKSSICNIYRTLKRGGVVLITVSGAGGTPISMSDYHNWGVYWRFTDMSLRRLLEEVFEKNSITIKAYGNVKTQMAFQYGMCAEELQPSDFEFYDEKYQMIIAAVATK